MSSAIGMILSYQFLSPRLSPPMRRIAFLRGSKAYRIRNPGIDIVPQFSKVRYFFRAFDFGRIRIAKRHSFFLQEHYKNGDTVLRCFGQRVPPFFKFVGVFDLPPINITFRLFILFIRLVTFCVKSCDTERRVRPQHTEHNLPTAWRRRIQANNDAAPEEDSFRRRVVFSVWTRWSGISP